MTILVRGIDMPVNADGCETIIRIQPDGSVLNLQKIHLYAEAISVPDVDLREMIQGEWIWDDDGMDWNLGSWRCSRCHSRPETTWQTMKNIRPLTWNGSHYCPNCGANMYKK